MNAAACRWARSALRRRWRAVALLTLLAAIAGGGALTAITGAHRSVVVVDEAMDEHLQPDVMGFVDLPGFDWGPVVRLPQVESYGLLAATGLCIKESGGLASRELCSQPPAAGDWYDEMWRMDIVQGRMPTAPGDIAVNRLAQRKYGWRVGDRLHIEGVRPGRLDDFWAGRAPGRRGWGPTFSVRIAGIFRGDDAWRILSGGVGVPGFVMSASFIPAHRDEIEYREQPFLRLHRGEADIPGLRAGITRITGDSGFPIRNVREAQRRVERSIRVEAVALVLFAAALVAAASLLLGQAVTRLVAAGTADAAILKSLGMGPRALVIALATPGLVVGLLGGIGAVAIAVAASSRVPIGLARDFDLHPGTKVDLAVLAPGAVAIVGAVALASIAAAAILTRRSLRAPAHGGRGAAAIVRLPLPPTVALGVRMAFEQRTGRAAIAARPAMLATAVAVLSVVAALSVERAISDTLARPERAGQTWDRAYFAAGVRAAAIAADEDVVAAAAESRALVDLNGLPIPAYAIRPVGTPLQRVVLHGRAPRRDDEIVLGPSTADALGLAVGERVRGGPDGKRMMRVVGTALLAEEGGVVAYDEGAWVTPAGLKRLDPPQLDWTRYLVDARPGADLAALDRRLGAKHEQAPPAAGLDNLTTIRRVPGLLAILLALLGAGAVGHMLVTTVRRRRRDLAILRTLGLSRGQARAVLAWQATTVAAVGVVVGLPLGVLVGDLVWRWIATSMPLDHAAPGAVPAAALVVPAAVLLVNVLALLPGWMAARVRPAAVLRAE